MILLDNILHIWLNHFPDRFLNLDISSILTSMSFPNNHEPKPQAPMLKPSAITQCHTNCIDANNDFKPMSNLG